MKQDVTVGQVARYRNLAVAPIYSDDFFMEEVLMLDKALQKEGFTITGSKVNVMEITNSLDEKVMVVGGATIEREEGQKRYAKFPALIMPHTSVGLPVNCAEQGESRIGGRYGGNSTIVMPCLRAGDISQREAWSSIENTRSFLRRMNPTIFMTQTSSYIADVEKNVNIEYYLDAIGRQPRTGQVGIVAGIRSGSDTIYYTDFFGRHQILSEAYDKLAKSFGIVAGIHKGSADDISVDDLAGFFKKFHVARAEIHPHVGAGSLYLLRHQEDKAELTGTALAYEDAPVQITMREKVER